MCVCGGGSSFFLHDHAKVQISKLEMRAIRKIVTLEMIFFRIRKRWQVLFVREREHQTDRQTDRDRERERHVRDDSPSTRNLPF